MGQDRRRRRQQPVELSAEQIAEQESHLERRALDAIEAAELAEKDAKADPKPGKAAIAMAARQTADAFEAMLSAPPRPRRETPTSTGPTPSAALANVVDARTQARERLAEANAQLDVETKLRAARGDALQDAREMAELEERALLAAKARLEVEAQARIEAEARAKAEADAKGSE